MNTNFRISIGDVNDRENTDKIFVPLTPNQIKSLIKKLSLITNIEESESDEMFSSKPGLVHILISSIEQWEKLK